MFHLGCANAERQRTECPMRCCMRITADNGHAGLCEALFRANDMDNALANIFHRKIGNTKFGCIGGKRLNLNPRFLVRNAHRPVGCRYIVVSNSKCAIGGTNLAASIAQAFKSLWAGHFMDKVPVDIDQTGAVILAMHNMCIPYLVKKGLGCRHLFLQRSAGEGLPGRSERSGGRGLAGCGFLSNTRRLTGTAT